MKKLSFFIASILMASDGLMAQTPFANENLMSPDLLGTARYVGMGGAMGALGTDISAISSNPASIGLCRRNDISLTFGVLTQKEKPNVGSDLTHMTFDQIGFVISTPIMGKNVKFVNFAFNYQKKANFSNTFIADNPNLYGLSQTQQMAEVVNYYNSPLGNLMYEAYLIDPVYKTDENGYVVTDEDGNGIIEGYSGYESDVNQYDRVTEGGILSYEFNISTNINDRVYAGVTVGLDKVDYRNTSVYTEGFYTDEGSNSFLKELYTVYNSNVISGNGINAKFGLIFRPIEYSAFRLGLALETPTAYNLEAYNSFSLDSPFDGNGRYDGERFYNYKGEEIGALYYNLSTPWKYRISMGHTIGTYLALGAEYEYSDYSKMRQSYDDIDYGSTVRDDFMKTLNKETLKGVHSFKFGMELNVTDYLALRCGYNFYSASYRDGGHLDHLSESPAFNYVTTTDYMKKSDVNIFTAGLGYKGKHFYADIAYKYRKQTADFYAFDDIYAGGNIIEPVFVDLTNHQVSMSLGYRF